MQSVLLSVDGGGLVGSRAEQDSLVVVDAVYIANRVLASMLDLAFKINIIPQSANFIFVTSGRSPSAIFFEPLTKLGE